MVNQLVSSVSNLFCNPVLQDITDVLCFPYLHDIAFLCAWVCDVYVVSPTGRVGLTVIANVQTGIGRVLFAISIYQP